jgi:hypothetical protein
VGIYDLRLKTLCNDDYPFISLPSTFKKKKHLKWHGSFAGFTTKSICHKKFRVFEMNANWYTAFNSITTKSIFLRTVENLLS